MHANHTKSFTDADLGQMMAAANQARAVEIRRLFGLAWAYVAGLFAPRKIVLAKG